MVDNPLSNVFRAIKKTARRIEVNRESRAKINAGQPCVHEAVPPVFISSCEKGVMLKAVDVDVDVLARVGAANGMSPLRNDSSFRFDDCFDRILENTLRGCPF